MYIVPAKTGPRTKGDLHLIPLTRPLVVISGLALVALIVNLGFTFKHAWVSFVLAGYFVALAAFSKLSVMRQRRRFATDFGGSLDAVRAVLDREGLREVRDQQGETKAIVVLRRQVRQLTLTQAIRIIRTL